MKINRYKIRYNKKTKEWDLYLKEEEKEWELYDSYATKAKATIERNKSLRIDRWYDEIFKQIDILRKKLRWVEERTYEITDDLERELDKLEFNQFEVKTFGTKKHYNRCMRRINNLHRCFDEIHAGTVAKTVLLRKHEK